jgi:hypothetical protein
MKTKTHFAFRVDVWDRGSAWCMTPGKNRPVVPSPTTAVKPSCGDLDLIAQDRNPLRLIALPCCGDETDLSKPPGELRNVIAKVEECLTERR